MWSKKVQTSRASLHLSANTLHYLGQNWLLVIGRRASPAVGYAIKHHLAMRSLQHGKEPRDSRPPAAHCCWKRPTCTHPSGSATCHSSRQSYCKRTSWKPGNRPRESQQPEIGYLEILRLLLRSRGGGIDVPDVDLQNLCTLPLANVRRRYRRDDLVFVVHLNIEIRSS